MTFFTLGAKWPGRGARGLAGSIFTVGAAGAAMPSCCRSWLRAIAPTPTPHWPKKWRRVEDFRFEISDCRFKSSLVISHLSFVEGIILRTNSHAEARRRREIIIRRSLRLCAFA